MSKALPVFVLAPIVAATAGLAAVGIGAFLLAKMAWNKGKAIAAELSPEDRSYLLPFGADYARQRLEAATITHQPLQGIEFGEALPAFNIIQGETFGLPSAGYVSQQALPGAVHGEIFTYIRQTAQAVGFQVEARTLSEGASILAFDLIPATEPRETRVRETMRRQS